MSGIINNKHTITNVADSSSLNTIAGYAGDLVYVTDKNALMQYDGTSWDKVSQEGNDDVEVSLATLRATLTRFKQFCEHHKVAKLNTGSFEVSMMCDTEEVQVMIPDPFSDSNYIVTTEDSLRIALDCANRKLTIKLHEYIIKKGT